MKIILKKDYQTLGYKDDVLTVKDGYARNYLIPQGIAILATPSALKELEESLKQRAHKLEKIKAEAEEAAKKYEGVQLTIAAKVSEGKRIYGSVGAPQVKEALEALGIETDQKLIFVKAVKELGQYMATIRLHKEVAVEVPFTVVSESPEESKPEAPATEETAVQTVEETIQEAIDDAQEAFDDAKEEAEDAVKE